MLRAVVYAPISYEEYPKVPNANVMLISELSTGVFSQRY
jgi:hypothetical protein